MDDTLRRLQLTQLEILKVVDKFCRENDLRYSLYAGTLLGAVRYKGFIPWDDDLDICMARDQYNRFIELWNQKRPKGYILQNQENTPGFTQTFSKIRKEHTTFLQPVDLPDRYHVGIFIDVFPVDRIPNGKVERLLFQVYCILFHLYTKEYIPIDANRVERVITKCLLQGVPKGFHGMIKKALLKKLESYDQNKDYQRIFADGYKEIKLPMPKDLMDNYCELEFEDSYLMSMSDWDTYLRTEYGDYMTPPPESERVPIHNAQIIDFEYDYYELQNCSKKELKSEDR